MLFSILLERIAIMALLMAVGVYLSRKGFLSEQGSRDLGAILLRIIIPCVIIKSYITEYSHQRLLELGLSALLALISYVVAMLLSYLVFGQRRRLENFAAAFCNAGFIGIPLVQAVVGQEGVFYIAASVALLNLFQWTYGVYIMTGRKDTISPKAIARNPVVISIVIGVALFLSRVTLPGILTSTLGYVADMNTPVAMILMGTYLARLPLRRMLDPAGRWVRPHAPCGDSGRGRPGVLADAGGQSAPDDRGIPDRRHPGGRQYLRVRPAVPLRL